MALVHVASLVGSTHTSTYVSIVCIPMVILSLKINATDCSTFVM